jgi:hypothetical protein
MPKIMPASEMALDWRKRGVLDAGFLAAVQLIDLLLVGRPIRPFG